MASSTRKEFEKHLRKVCHNKMLFVATMEFYDDFCSYYQGQTFTKDNFETLTINGEVVEQDIVRDLFKDRDEVLPEEVLTYLFKHNIKKLYAYKKEIPGEVGHVCQPKKELGVFMPSIIEKIKREKQGIKNRGYIRPHGMSGEEFARYIKEENKRRKKEFRERKKEIIAWAKADTYTFIKKINYHEMGHVFQIRTFQDGKYVKCDLSKETLINKFPSGECYEDELTDENINDSLRMKDVLSELVGSTAAKDFYFKNGGLEERFSDKIISIGYEAISEYMNEEFSLKIADEFSTLYGEPYYTMGDYNRKKQVIGNCSYNQNYDISQLVEIAIGDLDEKDMRFNGAKYFERIKNLQVSNKTLEKSKEKLHEIINSTKDKMPIDDRFELEIISRKVDDLDLVGLIGFAMGMYKSLNVNNTNVVNTKRDMIDAKMDCKLIVQNVLIEAIKNNILNDLADGNVVKDGRFFEKLNSTMQEIDAVVMYPRELTTYYRTSSYDEHVLNREVANIIDDFSVDEFARTYKNMPHIATFSELCSAVRISKTFYEEEIPNLDAKMPFFQQQRELDKKRFEKLETQRKSVERKKKADAERERLREARRNSLLRKKAEEDKKRNEMAETYGVDPSDVIVDGMADGDWF